MKEIFFRDGAYLMDLQKIDSVELNEPAQHSKYTLLFVPEGKGTYQADYGVFNYEGPVVLFSTPLQLIRLEHSRPVPITMLQFHSDFYCIEYHREEVACNGLLFNNIYIKPCVALTDREVHAFRVMLDDIREEFSTEQPSEIVLRSYLQLLLAKASTIKIRTGGNQAASEKDEKMEHFRQLLEQHFLTLHKPGDYAELLAMSANNLTKRCTRYFRKTPSQLIQDRLVLEAKKQLHLTRQSIKEIAYNLKFSDEYYFSRFFKKATKVSPQAFRKETGISIVADLSKD